MVMNFNTEDEDKRDIEKAVEQLDKASNNLSEYSGDTSEKLSDKSVHADESVHDFIGINDDKNLEIQNNSLTSGGNRGIISSKDKIEFTMDPPTLVLNPRGGELDKNPLCPKCKEQIVSVVGSAERRFTCGCNTIWRFSFKKEDEVKTGSDYDSKLEKDEDEPEWHPWEDDEE